MSFSHSTALMFAGIAVAGAAILTGGFLASASGDAALKSSYVAALGDTDTSWSTPSENVWLSGLTGQVATSRGLSVGDTITVASNTGAGERIVVTELEAIDGDRLGLPGLRFQLVTGRAPDDESSRTVRFLFANEATPAATARPINGNRSL